MHLITDGFYFVVLPKPKSEITTVVYLSTGHWSKSPQQMFQFEKRLLNLVQKQFPA